MLRPEELSYRTSGDLNAVTVLEASGHTTIGGIHIHSNSEQLSKVDKRTLDIAQLQEGLKQFYKLLEDWYHPLQESKTRHQLLEDYYVELHLEGVHRSGENVIQPTVPVEEVFLPCGTSRCPTRVLVKGHAGYGKSTFCKKLVHDWVEDSNGYMSPFMVVILIRLRDVTSTLEHEITKICNRATGVNYKQDQVIHSLQQLRSKALFILDGYDEISELGKVSLAKLLEYGKSDEESSLKLATVLMTTRPVYQFHADESNSMTSTPMVENETTSKICKSFERILNIDDITDDSQIAYVEKYFKNDTTKADSLKEILRKSEMKMTRSPLLLHLMCYIHQQGIKVKANEDFWEQYLRIIFKQAVRRKTARASDLNEEMLNSLVLQLGEIFFEHLKKNELYIEEREVYETFLENAPFIMSCGVLGKTFSLTLEHSNSNLLEPIHKTLMEYLSVKYVNDRFTQAEKSGHCLEFISGLISNNPDIVCIITSTTFSMEIVIPHLFAIQFLFVGVGSKSTEPSIRLHIIPISQGRCLSDANVYSVRIQYWYEGIVGILEFIEKSISILCPDIDDLKCFHMIPKLLDVHVIEFHFLEFFVSIQCLSAFCEAVTALAFDRSVNVSLKCIHENNDSDSLYPQTECQLEEISKVLLSQSNVKVFVDVKHKLREDQLSEFLLKEHKGDLSLSYVRSDINKKFLKDKQNKQKLRLRQKSKYVKIKKYKSSRFVELHILNHGKTKSSKKTCIIL